MLATGRRKGPKKTEADETGIKDRLAKAEKGVRGAIWLRSKGCTSIPGKDSSRGGKKTGGETKKNLKRQVEHNR